MSELGHLIRQVRKCTLCADKLEHGVRPIIQLSSSATVLIAGQAPGSKVHASGIPFDDASGDRLREWMGISKDDFYNSTKVAILPMGFCYPGKGKSGDLPPQKICAETWRVSLLEQMPRIQLVLVIGQYALAWHLPEQKRNLTNTVRAWAEFPKQTMPLPHPSPRNNIWIKKNSWFKTEVLPELKQRVNSALLSASKPLV